MARVCFGPLTGVVMAGPAPKRPQVPGPWLRAVREGAALRPDTDPRGSVYGGNVPADVQGTAGEKGARGMAPITTSWTSQALPHRG